MTVRDWRAGELRLLAAALVTAVAAVTSVGFLVDRIRLGLERDASQLLGADLVLSSDAPIDAALVARARAAGLQIARHGGLSQHGAEREGRGPECARRGEGRVRRLSAARPVARQRCAG